jgi:hypothetical protein
MSLTDTEVGVEYPDLSCLCCGEKEVQLFVCGRCQVNLYCSDTCKAWDWTEDGHGAQCKGFIGLKSSVRQRPSHRRRRASGISPEKAYEMIHNPPHNRPLTDKQRRFFWWIVNGRGRSHEGHHHSHSHSTEGTYEIDKRYPY